MAVSVNFWDTLDSNSEPKEVNCEEVGIALKKKL
jgi:hypothetical protein